MKLFLNILLLVVCLNTAAYSAENKKIALTGDLFIKPIQLVDKFAIMTGIRGKVIFPTNYAVGLSSFNQISHPVLASALDTASDSYPRLSFNYFSLDLEKIFDREAPVSWVAGLGLCVAHASYSINVGEYSLSSVANSSDYGGDWFYMVEPSAGAYFNINKWFRISAGATYRLAFGLDYKYGQDKFVGKDLSGVAGYIGFVFGEY